jgi:hypothetical protein
MKAWPPESEFRQRAASASASLERLREERARLDAQIASFELSYYNAIP